MFDRSKNQEYQVRSFLDEYKVGKHHQQFFSEAKVCCHAALPSMRELLPIGNPECDLLMTLHHILQTFFHSPLSQIVYQLEANIVRLNKFEPIRFPFDSPNTQLLSSHAFQMYWILYIVIPHRQTNHRSALL